VNIRSGADHCVAVLQSGLPAPAAGRRRSPRLPALSPRVPRSEATQHGQLRNAARSEGKNEMNRCSKYLCRFPGGGVLICEDSKQ
jgi:hypothetical protein